MGTHSFLLCAFLRVCGSLPPSSSLTHTLCGEVCARTFPCVNVQKRRLRVCRSRDGGPVLRTTGLCAHGRSCSGSVSRSESNVMTARRACLKALSDSGSQGLKVWFPACALQ